MKKILVIIISLMLSATSANAVKWDYIPKSQPVSFIDTDSVRIINDNIFAAVKSWGNITYYKINPYTNKYILLYFEEFDENKYKSDNILKYDINNPAHYHKIYTEDCAYIIKTYCPSCPTVKLEEQAFKEEMQRSENLGKQYNSYFGKTIKTVYNNWKKPDKITDKVNGMAVIRINKNGSVATYIIRKPISESYKQSIIDAINKSKFDPLPESMGLDFINLLIPFPI